MADATRSEVRYVSESELNTRLDRTGLNATLLVTAAAAPQGANVPVDLTLGTLAFNNGYTNTSTGTTLLQSGNALYKVVVDISGNTHSASYSLNGTAQVQLSSPVAYNASYGSQRFEALFQAKQGDTFQLYRSPTNDACTITSFHLQRLS